MARYIDADKLDTRERGNNSQRTMWREIERIVNNAPTADVVEVVRCKDCKHWKNIVFDPIIEHHIGECHCSKWENDYFWYETSEKNFCGYGKRSDT